MDHGFSDGPEILLHAHIVEVDAVCDVLLCVVDINSTVLYYGLKERSIFVLACLYCTVQVTQIKILVLVVLYGITVLWYYCPVIWSHGRNHMWGPYYTVTQIKKLGIKIWY